MFTAALVIYFKPEWAIIDPICTFIFSVLVLATTISILRNTLEVLMEAAPPGISHDVVEVSVFTIVYWFIGLSALSNRISILTIGCMILSVS